MKITNLQLLMDFCEKHPNSKKQFESWLSITNKSKWNNLNDISKTYSFVSFLSNERVVFNIKGNNYRLIVIVKIKLDTVYIRWIGTHSEYDKIDAQTI